MLWFVAVAEPDVFCVQECDNFEFLSERLGEMGYACAAEGDAPYVPLTTDFLLHHSSIQMWRAQKFSGDKPPFPGRAFDAMLVGCCGVRRGAHPLARRLAPDIICVIEEFATPWIAPRASALLREAASDFVRRIGEDATLHAVHRGSICVHAGDVDAVIEMSGADRLAGRRRTSGCSCAACVGSPRAEGSHLLREQRPPPSEFCRVEPAALSRPSVSWCEAAIDGPTPQAAIRQALITLTRQAGVSILVPGALNAIASALVGFCDTVLTRARGGDSQLLRDIAASGERSAIRRRNWLRAHIAL